jgi:mevalonate kinase
MPAISATAPGKVILFGEHAVVYGRPAIATPVTQVKAKVIVTANPRGDSGAVRVQAPDIGLEAMLEELEPADPLAVAIQGVASALKVKRHPACTIRITSTIPVAAGMGSGAAVSVAVIRAFSAFLGHPLPDDKVSALTYEVEKIYHGTPSGIDNTVITYARPVYFVKGKPIETLKVRRSFTLVIGDTGVSSPTAAAVGGVRKAWQAGKSQYEAYFDSVGAIAESARQAIEGGAVELLGPLMDANHGVLRKIGVSSPELDSLVTAARRAGAWGAKLSGAGQGGNMIALVPPDQAEMIAKALQKAGAARTIVAQIK